MSIESSVSNNKKYKTPGFYCYIFWGLNKGNTALQYVWWIILVFGVGYGSGAGAWDVDVGGSVAETEQSRQS